MNYFDKQASEFDAEKKRIAMASEIGDAMLEGLKLRPDNRVMDYGTGTGLIALKLQPHAGSIVAVDTSPKMLEILQDKQTRIRATNIETLLWNVEEDELLPEPFDAIVSSMVMHHIPNIQEAVERFYRMLNDGGKIALADLDSEEGDFHPTDSPVFHHGFDRGQFEADLNKAGFKDVRIKTASHVTKPNVNGVLKEYSIFLAIAGK